MCIEITTGKENCRLMWVSQHRPMKGGANIEDETKLEILGSEDQTNAEWKSVGWEAE